MNEWEWQLLEDKTPAESIRAAGVEMRKGDRVRLRPRAGGDIFDLALDGQTALIEAIEQDYEGKLHLAVVLEDDPGKDLGMLRQPGHRFFFSAEEVEPLAAPSILIAGIGNIFLGDDGFGVEVTRRLASRRLPETVRVADFGIRGYDLAFALLDGRDFTILVDAVGRGGAPGTLFVIEPDVAQNPPDALDAHAMNPMCVLQLARSMGPIPGRIVLVGCEPATLGGEEGHMGLSDTVLSAVEEAASLIEDLVIKLLRGDKLEQALENSPKGTN
ncbi:MAG: hydrogenase maturation protease [Bryobacteraceae bacterium]|jgi:hydrogenase maturation protease